MKIQKRKIIDNNEEIILLNIYKQDYSKYIDNYMKGYRTEPNYIIELSNKILNLRKKILNNIKKYEYK